MLVAILCSHKVRVYVRVALLAAFHTCTVKFTGSWGWTPFAWLECSFVAVHLYVLLDFDPEHFQRFRDKLSGLFGFLAALGKRFF